MKERLPECVVEMEQRLRQIAKTVRRQGRTFLEQYGITPPQFDALLTLHREGELTIGDLSSRLYLAYSTTTDLVDRLEGAGFVARQRSQSDRRVVQVRILNQGSDLIEHVLDARRSYLNTVLQPLSLDEKKDILRALELLDATMN